jgi:hypothetical protein
MATDATIKRTATRAAWLLENPTTHEWLAAHTGTFMDIARDPQGRAMAESLKKAGIYSQKTVAGDICVAMRRLARNTPLRNQQ